MRHGQVPQVVPRRFLGQRDVPLDAEGVHQALRAAKFLAEETIDAAWSSDLLRTRATAEAVLAPHGIMAEADPLLREISLGSWEGLTVEEVRRQYPGEYERRGQTMADYRTPGGESFRDVQGRAVRFLSRLESCSGTVLVVAHGGFNRTLLCHVTGRDLADLFSIKQEYCCLNELHCKAGRWSVNSMNLPCR